MSKPSKEAHIQAIAEMLEKIPADKVERLYQHIQFLWRKNYSEGLSKKTEEQKGA
ncbi:hypothetical protein [Enterococcus wangshanyuanii]|uniref:DUF2281 domain-containing protein n=1 Tax=Enterococcus wangshanyuanii TaxID=2005703 RepID=A0ABQ1NEH4_9ENTE|nr:hypothetical protein [Enterococcus wangshanyuanii]GGC74562.1 hypothetical protein GCM10011573_00070 [Enterococcus wangshanyuanii]